MNMCSHNIGELSSLLKLVSEKNRLKILWILKKEEICVCKIVEELSLSQSLVSHHLKDLKDAGLVKDAKRGQWVHYSLTKNGERVVDLLFSLQKKNI